MSLRIALVATLEHFAAVMSKGFLGWQGAWDFRCAYARELFTQHAREEMGHRSVAFDLWLAAPTYNRFGRSLVLAGVLLAGAAPTPASPCPGSCYRKLGGRLTATLSGLARFGMRGLLQPTARHSLRELFLFARRDFHPRSLADETAAATRTPLALTREPTRSPRNPQIIYRKCCFEVQPPHAIRSPTILLHRAVAAPIFASSRGL